MTVAIIPAGGQATRIFRLPKYLLPSPDGVLIEVLQRRMQKVLPRAVVVAATNGNRQHLAPYISPSTHVFDGISSTMSEAVLQARIEAQNDNVIFGMPDTYFNDEFAFEKLVHELDAGADMAVGVFYTDPQQRNKLGMCDLLGSRITHVEDKPKATSKRWAWGVLAWKPVCWDYMAMDDPHVGYALPRLLESKLDIRAVRMQGRYWDCGTPDSYFDMIAAMHTREYAV